MSRDLTPQDKKRKSLEHDRRNCFGENDKSSRKAIRQRKAIVNRSFRRATKQALSDQSTDADALADNVTHVQRNDWKKVPDKALGDHLLDKAIRRINQRLSTVSDSAALLDAIESQLIEADVPHQAVQDIIRQLSSRSCIPRRWGTSLKIDYEMAGKIISILNRDEA